MFSPFSKPPYNGPTPLLPRDVVLSVAQNLKLGQLRNLSLCCKHYYAILQYDEGIWKEKFIQYQSNLTFQHSYLILQKR
jgi:hypothetical protein